MSLVGQADSRGTCYEPCSSVCGYVPDYVAPCDEPAHYAEYCAQEVGTTDCIPVVKSTGEGLEHVCSME